MSLSIHHKFQLQMSITDSNHNFQFVAKEFLNSPLISIRFCSASPLVILDVDFMTNLNSRFVVSMFECITISWMHRCFQFLSEFSPVIAYSLSYICGEIVSVISDAVDMVSVQAVKCLLASPPRVLFLFHTFTGRPRNFWLHYVDCNRCRCQGLFCFISAADNAVKFSFALYVR